MSVKVFTLWNLLPRTLEYEFGREEKNLDDYAQFMISELNAINHFVIKSNYRGEAYLDDSFERFFEEYIESSDHVIILLTEDQIELLERYIYARWFIFSMKFQALKEKVAMVILGKSGRGLKQNWDLICHKIYRIQGDKLSDWIEKLDWISQLFREKTPEENTENTNHSSVTMESVIESNQMTALNMTNQRAFNCSVNENSTDERNFSSDYSGCASEIYFDEEGPLFTPTGQQVILLRKVASCPELNEMCLNFERSEKKRGSSFSKKFFCSVFFSLDNINDGSLYVDKSDRDIIFNREVVGGKRKRRKKIFANILQRRKGQNKPDIIDNQVSSQIIDNSHNKYNIMELNNDYILSETHYKPYFDDSCIVDSSSQAVSLPLQLPPYTEPTDPSSQAYSYVKERRASSLPLEEPEEIIDHIDITHSATVQNPFIENIIIHQELTNATYASVGAESVKNKDDLEPITEITESYQQLDNSDNTSKIAGDISMSGSSTMSSSTTNNPWGSVESYPEVEVKKTECEQKSGLDSGLCFESPSSGILIQAGSDEVLQEPDHYIQEYALQPICSALSPTLMLKNPNRLTSDGLISGAVSPNIMTRSVLMTGSSCESDHHGTSRLRMRNREATHTSCRKRSVSPVYRDDKFRLSRRYQHQSRIDLPIRRRTNSTRNYNEFYPYSDFSDGADEKFPRTNLKRPGNSYTQRQSRDPSLVASVDIDEMSLGDMPSREASSERNGQIKSTQLPDGGWLTGVFSWFGGSRAPTPIIGRRDFYASRDASTSRDVDSDVEFKETKVFPTSASVVDFVEPSSSDHENPNRQRTVSTSRSDTAGRSRMPQTDFVISLINPLSQRSLRHLPRHVYWFYTSVAPTQQRLSQMMAEYRSNIPRVYDKVKSVISDNRTKIACLFIGTALFVPTAHHLIPANAELTADAAISYRFGNMINLLRPSLMWTGSAVITKFRPGLYSLRSNER